MEFFLIYLFVISEKVAQGFSTLATASFTGLIVFLFILVLSFIIASAEYNMNTDEIVEHRLFKLIKKVLITLTITLVVSAPISTLIPSKQDLAIIIGTGVTYNVLTSDKAKEIGGKSLQLLEKKIDEALKDEVVTQ